MTTNSTSRWRTAFFVCLALMIIGYATGTYSVYRFKKDRVSSDSTLFNSARTIVSRYVQENESLKAALKASDLARLDEYHAYQRHDSAQIREIRHWKRQALSINTSRASVPELDSLQRSLYGPPPDDSVHTIPLDYSRKLTGDALRLPIEQRLSTLWETRYDSLEAHSGRLIGSYKLDLEMYRQHNEDAMDKIDTLQHIAGDMQGVIDRKSKENDKIWKGRNRERVIGVILIITALIL